MKLDITAESSEALLMNIIEDGILYSDMKSSLALNDFGRIKKKIDSCFSYTGDQLAAFKSEWEQIASEK